MTFKNAYEAYEFVKWHPKLIYKDSMQPWIEITPHMVDGYGKVSDNPEFNLHLEWWVECGPYADDENHIMSCNMISFHDYDLDCGGSTADEAIINLAKLVFEKYGDYEE